MFPTATFLYFYRDKASRIVIEMKYVPKRNRLPDPFGIPVVPYKKTLDKRPRYVQQIRVFLYIPPMYCERPDRNVHPRSVGIASLTAERTPLHRYLTINAFQRQFYLRLVFGLG
jgi:hypothetical protein